MRDIYTKIFTSRKFWNIFIPVILFTLVSGGLFLFHNKPKTASAGWWNESWTYRKAIQVTNNSTEESNVYIEVVLDTSATTTIQSDCGDFRFATENGKELEYYIVSGCGTATNTIHIEFETFSAGSQDLYFYYGNPSAENGFQQNDFVTEASNYTLGSIGAEEVGKGPVGYWSFDEGYGSIAHDSSSGGNDGTITGATWQDESMCVSGKCLYFDGDDTTEVTVDTPDNMEKFTACVWFKANALSNIDGDSTMKILAKGWGLNLLDTGIIDFRVPTSAAHIEIESTIIISPNKWYYVCAINNSIGVDPQLYINGNDDSSNSYGGSGTISDDSANLLRIGAMYPNEYAYNFYGYIDEIKIYPYARTADQIKQDYNAGLAGVSTSKGTSVSFGSQSDSWMSDGLVGYWKMDETATTSGAIDSSGNGNNGTYHGTASTTGGKFGNGGVFDGDSDYITGSTTDYFLDKVTISSWVKFNKHDNQYIFTNSYNDWSGFLLYEATGFNTARFSIGTADGNKLVESSSVLDNDQWYLITATFDGEKLLMYIDGLQSGEPTYYTGNIGDLGEYYVLGSSYYLGGSFLDGQIDEVRIYNRALSPDEVKKLYEWAPGPVLHLKMDEKQGTTAYDSSGYGNDGTLGGDGLGTDLPIWDRGKYGSALKFDGDDDYAEITNSETINSLVNNGVITVDFWMKQNNYGSDTDGLISFYKDGLNRKYLFIRDSGQLQLTQTIDSSSDSQTSTYSLDNNNNWYYVTWLIDGINNDLYIDGKFQESISMADTISDMVGNPSIFIGSSNGSSLNFNGNIDDVKIYNYARTQKQILEDMNGGRPASKLPVAYWKFDEGYGATVHDESGNGNDGTASSSDSGTNTTVSEMWSLDGKYNKAMEFDKTNDYVSFSGSIYIKTFSLWIKLNSVEATELFSFTETSGPSYNFYVYDSDGNIKYPSEAIAYIDGEENHYVKDTDWHNLIIVFDTALDVDKLFLGKFVSGSMYPYGGKIDELKIFNYALSEDEVKKEYNRGAGVILGSTGLDSNGSADNSSNREYCIPGDTATCTPPVLELKMDEKEGTTVYDTSGNGNDGKISGATWGRGKLGSGLEFDGVDDRMKISADSTINNVYPMTLSFWVNSSFNSGDTLFEKGNISNNSGYEIKINNNRLELQFDFDGGMMQYVSASDFLVTNEWQFITLIWDGTSVVSNIKLYGNGKLDVPAISSDGSGSVEDNSSYDLYIGSGFNVTPVSNFPGKLDDIKMFNYARTPAQIAWDYNRGKPIAEWRFDECQGNIAHDNSGNGNHGTITIGSSGSQTELGNCSSSTSASAWYNGRTGKTNSSLYFDGTDDYISVGDLGASSSAISFWLKPGSLNQGILSLDVSEHYISIASGNIVASGFVSPKIYVDGIESSKIDTAWHHVFIETTSEIDVSNLSIARSSSDGGTSWGYYTEQIDDLKIYSYFPTEEQIKMDYNNGSARF